MTAPMNRRYLLASRPEGRPKASDLRLDTQPIPEPAEGAEPPHGDVPSAG